MALLLENTARFRRGRVGLPKKVKAQLFDDRVCATATDGTSVMDIPLADLQQVSKGPAYLLIKQDDQLYSLEFISPWAKATLGIGRLFSPGGRIAKQWQSVFEEHGVKVGRKLL